MIACRFVIVLFFCPRFTVSGYTFDIFKHFIYIANGAMQPYAVKNAYKYLEQVTQLCYIV
jgi:hypothetical protein